MMTDDDLKRAYAAGAAIADLAAHYGVAPGTIRNRLSALGARRDPKQARSESPAARAIRAELAHGPATSAALATRTGYTQGTIQVMLFYLRRAGVVRKLGSMYWRLR